MHTNGKRQEEYGKISIPVLVVYGDQDWPQESERHATVERIPGARLEVVKNGGHFLGLDRTLGTSLSGRLCEIHEVWRLPRKKD